KHRVPSAGTLLPAAGSPPAKRIRFFTSTLSTIRQRAVAAYQENRIKPGNSDFSANRMGRKSAPIVRQFLLLFGEGDEASPPGVEGDFSQKPWCFALVRYLYDKLQNEWGIR